MNFEIAASLMGMEIIAFIIGISTIGIIVMGCFWLYFKGVEQITKKLEERLKERNDVDYLAESLHHIFEKKDKK